VVRERRQVIDAVAGDNDHAPPFAAIAPVGPAMGHIFLAAEADAPVPAAAALDFDGDAVNEHRTAAVSK
jgi:hypothetical protein